MTDRLYPSKLVKPNTPLYYDGADYRVPFIDKQSDGDHSQRVSTLADRGLVWPATLWAGSIAAGAIVAEWTYTVPAGRRALLASVLIIVQIPASAGNAYFYITVNGSKVVNFSILQATVQPNNSFHFAPQLWLKAGDVLVGTAGNSTTGALNVTGSAFINEYDA